MEDIGWGLDAYGIETWGTSDDDAGGIDAVGFEPMDGVVISPGVFVFEIF